MKRPVVIVATIIAALAIVALVLRIADSEHDNRRRADIEVQSTEQPTYSGLVAEAGDTACEVLVEFGRVPRSSTTTKAIRVINTGTTPLVLLDYSTQCRCMWLEYSREPIEAGSYSELELSFDSRGEWGSVGNYMEITTSREGTPIVLWIAAEVE